MNNSTVQHIASKLVGADHYLDTNQQEEAISNLLDAFTALFEEILFQEYRSEFETYDYEGTIHRDGLTFEEWAHRKGYLSYTKKRESKCNCVACQLDDPEACLNKR